MTFLIGDPQGGFGTDSVHLREQLPAGPMVADAIPSFCTLWTNAENMSGVTGVLCVARSGGPSRANAATMLATRVGRGGEGEACGAAGGRSVGFPGFPGLECCNSLSRLNGVRSPGPCCPFIGKAGSSNR